jgi:hypothetical protein
MMKLVARFLMLNSTRFHRFGVAVPDDWDMAPAIVRLIESAHDNERLSN